jgi:hypothetical protein
VTATSTLVAQNFSFGTVITTKAVARQLAAEDVGNAPEGTHQTNDTQCEVTGSATQLQGPTA